MEERKKNSASTCSISTIHAELLSNLDLIKETKTLVQHKSERQRFDIAKKHFLNALHFRKLRLDLQLPEVSKITKNIYKWQTNFMWETLLFIISYVFMYLAFLGDTQPHNDLIAVEIILLSIFMIDFVMEIHHKTIKTRLTTIKFQPRFYIKLVTVLLLFADSIISLSLNEFRIRPFLILRCVLPVMYDQRMRKLVYALFCSYTDILVYAIFYAVILLFFAIAANQIIKYPEGTKFDDFTENYDDLGKTVILFYVLGTFDNFPNNQLKAIKAQLWIFAFFIVFSFLNVLFFITIPSNILLNSIIETRSKSVIIDEIEQQNNLIMAFITLGGDDKISIPYEKVIRFLLFVFNNETRFLDKIMEICRSLDEKVNGSIEVNEFMQICKIIESKSYLRPPSFTWSRMKTFRSYIHDNLKLKSLLKRRSFNIIISMLIIITFFNSILEMYTEIKIFSIIDDVLLVLYILEVLLRLVALGVRDFSARNWNIFDSMAVTLCFILQISTNDNLSSSISVIIKMVRIFRVTLLMQIISDHFKISFTNLVFTKLSELMNQIAIIIPIILKFFPLYMISFYFLGVLGLQIFGYVSEISPSQSPYGRYEQYSNFYTLFGAHYICIQVFTGVSWSTVAFDHAYRYGAFAATMLFFILSHQVIVVILTSLMKGVTWELYNTIHKKHEDYKKKKIEQEENECHLKKRMEIFEEIKEKIEKHEYILPDNIVTRELYEKKIDQEILSKLTEVEMRKRNSHPQRPRKPSSNNKKMLPIPLFQSIILLDSEDTKKVRRKSEEMSHQEASNLFLEIPKTRGNMKKNTISRKEMSVESPSFISRFEIQHNLETVFQSESESHVEMGDLNEDNVEKEINGVLSQVELHSGVKYSVKVENPTSFLIYLKSKLRSLRMPNFKEDFDINNDVFVKKDSLNLMVHGLQTLLEMETSGREQKGEILKIMIKKGLISEEKALKILTEKSEFENDVTFDYNWIIRNTYLKNINENKVTQFEIEYFSSIYGKSFKDINKTTVYPLLKLESQLSYCFSNLLRYREVTTHEFFNTLSYIENKISTKLFQTGSLCKFVFQIDMNSETWFTVEHKNSNELRVHFIKNGIWLYHEGLKEDEIYAARDAFNFPEIHKKKEQEKEEIEMNIKKLFQTFESLSFCIHDFNQFFNQFPEMETYDLFTFFRNVEETKRYVKKPLSICKIMLVLLAKEDERDDPIPYSLSDMKFDDEEIEEYKKEKQKNIKLDESDREMFEKLKNYEMKDEEISDKEGLPYSYIINFLTGIRECLILNEKNFIYHVEKVLNQNFKEEEKLLCSGKFTPKFEAKDNIF